MLSKSSLQEFLNFVKINKRNDAVKLIITNECKIGCRHCAPMCTNEKSLMDQSIIDETIRQISTSEQKWTVGVQGGEAMYYTETIEYIFSEAKKYGHLTGLTTSGYWRNRKDLVEFMDSLVERKLIDYLLLSYDEWHNEKIPKEWTLWLKDRYKHKIGTFLQYCFIWENGMDKSEFKYQDCVVIRPMIVFGGGQQFDWILEADDFDEPTWVQCEYNGFAVELDGTVHMQCTNWSKGCAFGKIFDVDLLDLRKRIGRPKMKLKQHYYKHCYKEGIAKTGKPLIHVLDKSLDNTVISDDYFWNVEYGVNKFIPKNEPKINTASSSHGHL